MRGCDLVLDLLWGASWTPRVGTAAEVTCKQSFGPVYTSRFLRTGVLWSTVITGRFYVNISLKIRFPYFVIFHQPTFQVEVPRLISRVKTFRVSTSLSGAGWGFPGTTAAVPDCTHGTPGSTTTG